ncbi:MAG: hypothetical protein M0P18_07670, partial [Syntrophales bacterium]|nr:hypothetical protein [Syntrophales bacterium]
FGDNGYVEFAGPVGSLKLSVIRSTEPSAGGDDVIVTGNGEKYIIGGPGADLIGSGNGNDVLFGDHGVVVYDAAGRPSLVYTIEPATGGDDEVRTTGGTNILIGGAGSDSLYGGSGRDAIFGDCGQVTLVNGQWEMLTTTHIFIGDDDFLSGGPGNDIMMGGAGNDIFVGNLSEDIMIGSYGRVTFVPSLYQVITIERLDSIDLVSNVMTELYSREYVEEVFDGAVYRDEDSAEEGWYLGTGAGGWEVGAAGVNLADHDGSYDLTGMSHEPRPPHHHGSISEGQTPAGVEEDTVEAGAEDGSEDQTAVEDVGGHENGTGSGEEPGDADAAPLEGADYEESAGEDSGRDEYDEDDGTDGVQSGIGATIAGIMGWKVLSGTTPARTAIIDRESFRELAARQEKRRFKRWRSVGL